MPYIMVDIEADGPAPGIYSMVAIGAIVVEPTLSRTFYGLLRPISDIWVPEALKVSGFTREQTLEFPEPQYAMKAFADWIELVREGRWPRFVADNNGFDFAFVNWYCWKYLNRNPFGYSSVNLASMWQGMNMNVRAKFKHLRKTRHTHNPVDDAKGNAEVMLAMIEKGMKL